MNFCVAILILNMEEKSKLLSILCFIISVSSVQSLSCVRLCDPMDSLVHRQLPEFTQTHVHWVDDAIQLSHTLLALLYLPSIFPSIRIFSNELALCIRWPKFWSFIFSISPSNKYSRLISFRIDPFELLTVQGTLKSLLLHCNSKVIQLSSWRRAQIWRHSKKTTVCKAEREPLQRTI